MIVEPPLRQSMHWAWCQLGWWLDIYNLNAKRNDYKPSKSTNLSHKRPIFKTTDTLRNSIRFIQHSKQMHLCTWRIHYFGVELVAIFVWNLVLSGQWPRSLKHTELKQTAGVGNIYLWLFLNSSPKLTTYGKKAKEKVKPNEFRLQLNHRLPHGFDHWENKD